MHKKIMASLITLFISSGAFAYNGPFSGFYGGVDIGWINTEVDAQIIENALPPYPVTFSIHRPFSLLLTDDSVTGGVAVGYSRIMKEMFLVGLEGRANFEGAEADFESTANLIDSFALMSVNTHAKLENDFALLLKLGMLLDPKTNVYGLIGASWGHFNVSTGASYSQTMPPYISTTAKGHESQSTYETGWIAGIGVEHLITNHLSLALEYTHADYGDLDVDNVSRTLINTGAAPLPAGSLSVSNDLNAKTDSVTFRLTYYFDNQYPPVKYKG